MPTNHFEIIARAIQKVGRAKVREIVYGDTNSAHEITAMQLFIDSRMPLTTAAIYWQLDNL